MIRPLTIDRTRYLLARVGRWEKTTAKGKTVDAHPPLDAVRDMLATPEPPLPVLSRIVETPVFAPDGQLASEPGYHAAARVYVAPPDGLEVPPVSERPTTAEVERARELICDELLEGFPFTGDAEKAHAVALLLLPFARDMIDGHTPLHLIEKPSPGTGGTLLADALALPATGRPLAATTEARDEDEWRKRITAKLLGSPAHVLIDNLRRPLDSAALSAAITAPAWEDRILGKSEMIRMPVRCCWVATGNNPSVSDEIARRTVRIRLDAREERPQMRTGFRHADLRAWATRHAAISCGRRSPSRARGSRPGDRDGAVRCSEASRTGRA